MTEVTEHVNRIAKLFNLVSDSYDSVGVVFSNLLLLAW